jgi:hypothetical protein
VPTRELLDGVRDPTHHGPMHVRGTHAFPDRKGRLTAEAMDTVRPALAPIRFH